MPLFEIEATAHSAIMETWRVEAASEAEARELFVKGEAEFCGDKVVGEAMGRILADVREVNGTLPTLEPEAPAPLSFEAVRFVKKVANSGQLWVEGPAGNKLAELVAEARRIAERLR